MIFVGFLLLAWRFESDTKVFHYLPVFALGVAAFLYSSRLITLVELLGWLAGFGVACELTLEPLVGVVGVATALVILFVQLRQKWLLALGVLSYSIYLIHVPVGGRVISLGARLSQEPWMQACVRVVAVVVTLGAAYLLWRFVEKPAMKWAGKVTLKK